ncbi:hypothetical protein MCOR12_011074 [Pyricularia oryzae]|uniref:Uncharacterized protein n=1 Tax=Pyricularia oryzae TaxID=318829 RepID=A0A4P7NCJ6_PYROR|nr:hypothetical protein MCOR09_007555 [Pyricularia oryzae]KAI6582840.1 hypothetical protein MCOR12_011074 [Pyricularia oryzae]QBZ58330.1 hypothetical protein PoMZ_03280 [Pyricularia oryzae]
MRFSDADGYARGESVVCVMLKTISQTLADGDHMYAIVRETGPGWIWGRNKIDANISRPTVLALRPEIGWRHRPSGTLLFHPK